MRIRPFHQGGYMIPTLMQLYMGNQQFFFSTTTISVGLICIRTPVLLRPHSFWLPPPPCSSHFSPNPIFLAYYHFLCHPTLLSRLDSTIVIPYPLTWSSHSQNCNPHSLTPSPFPANRISPALPRRPSPFSLLPDALFLNYENDTPYFIIRSSLLS